MVFVGTGGVDTFKPDYNQTELFHWARVTKPDGEEPRAVIE